MDRSNYPFPPYGSALLRGPPSGTTLLRAVLTLGRHRGLPLPQETSRSFPVLGGDAGTIDVEMGTSTLQLQTWNGAAYPLRCQGKGLFLAMKNS